MIGRQVIETTRGFALTELEAFMRERWDTAQYNDFIIGRPTAASVEEYILLPATQRFMVIAYPRVAGGLFSRKDKVVLSVCETPKGAVERLSTSMHRENLFYSIWSISKDMSLEKERKGPAEDALQKYAAHMRELLEAAGYVK